MSYDWGLPCSEERSFTPRFHDHCHSPHIISIPIPLPLDYYSPCLLSRVPFASILTRKDIHPFCRLNDQIRESLCAWSVVGFDNFEGVLKRRWILLRVDGIIQNIFLSLKMILSECNRWIAHFKIEISTRIWNSNPSNVNNYRKFEKLMYMKLFDRSVFKVVWNSNGELYPSLWLDIVMCNRRLWRFHDENEFCSISCC